MNPKVENPRVMLLVVLFAAIFCLWIFFDSPEAIADSNGPDDFSLQTITDENIINLDIGMTGGIDIRNDIIGDGLTFSSDGFTGVYEVMHNNYIGNSDVNIRMTLLTVTEGNFRAVVVHNDEIIEELPFNTEDPFIDLWLHDINGTVSFRIAGESAAFRFDMLKSDYDSFAHP